MRKALNLGACVRVSYALFVAALAIAAVSLPHRAEAANSPTVNGKCGTANQSIFASAPTTGLCSAGTASTVEGAGPWNWSCAGSGGGTTRLCEANTFSGNPVAFTPLHTYYLAPGPAGNDSNPGTRAQPWATPNHAVVCGDVIIAAAGTYGNQGYTPFGGTSWGQVSGCPSTSGAIDGAGGIYFATLLCAGPRLNSCNVTNTSPYSKEAFRVGASNWAVEGFAGTGPANSGSACFVAVVDNLPLGVIHHIAFINDVATNCGAAGFGSFGYAEGTGVDQTAIVGAIAYNSAQASGVCGSGVSVIPANGPDASPGTHVFVAGTFSYANINGFCGNRSNGSGSYTTTTASAAPGATSITVAAITNWVVGLPIGDLGDNAYNFTTPIIPAGTVITSISPASGSCPCTIGLSNPVANPGVQTGDNIAAMTTTDGEGIIFDTWLNYSYQGVVEQNVLWHNGSAGYEMFCNGTCQSALSVAVFANSLYDNNQDPKHQYSGFEFFPNQAPADFLAKNNLAHAGVTQPPGTVYNAQAGTGWPVVAAAFGQTGLIIKGNQFKSAPGAGCPEYAACDSGNDIADYNGANYDLGDRGPANFKNPRSLRKAAPDCVSQSNTTNCMIADGVVGAITATGASAGHGYQPPAACKADAYYPAWLKGVVYLTVSAAGIVENSGLINKPCGL